MAETRMQGRSSIFPFLSTSEVLTLVGPLQLWMCFPLFRLFAILEGPCNSAKIYLVLVVFLDGRAGGGKSKGQIYMSCKCICMYKLYNAQKLSVALAFTKSHVAEQRLCQRCQQRRVHKQDQHDG